MRNFTPKLKLCAKAFSLSLFAWLPMIASGTAPTPVENLFSNQETAANRLGWIPSNTNHCGGFYKELPIAYPERLIPQNLLLVNSDEVLFAQHSTSVLQGHVVLTRPGQQIIVNKAYIYRDPTTGKISAIDLISGVQYHEPNTFVVGQNGHYDVKTKGKKLNNVTYRMAIYGDINPLPIPLTNAQMAVPHNLTQLSAWGTASQFQQDQPKIMQFEQATYTSCAPTTNTWHVKASHMVLNKITGRGYATNARLYIKDVAVAYTPYFNFPIDHRRQSGFLWPVFGTSTKAGLYVGTPYYWNIAPNYDTTITPQYMSKRGMQVADLFRYMTKTSQGHFNMAVLPNDQGFATFKKSATATQFLDLTNNSDVAAAEYQRLQNASDTRKLFTWNDISRFNEHWSSDIDFNYLSDDYYLQDFGGTLDSITQNQLNQEGELNYQSTNWNVTGRAQGYQTLHPINQAITFNQYSRLPQLTLGGDFPDQVWGSEYFVSTDLTHFAFTQTPGYGAFKQPIGDRMNVQPGVSLPFNWPAANITPRVQMALTKYQLGNVDNHIQANPDRAVPIFDTYSNINFDRQTSYFAHPYTQTLQPELYYLYVPYHNQDKLPLFDTTLNGFAYDQLFNYNRFTSIDRIGDANQLSYALTSRFIDNDSGAEKFRASVGQIYYFVNRRVTPCTNAGGVNNSACPLDDKDHLNSQRLSATTGLITYSFNPNWSASSNTNWNTRIEKLDTENLGFTYKLDAKRVINASYNFSRNGDTLPTRLSNPEPNVNLSTTDLSAAWPIAGDWSAVGRWAYTWDRHRFQDLLYGVEYDSCCWAVRLVAGRTFTNLTPSSTYQYNTAFFVQFALKGLGVLGSGDPSQLLLTTVGGYQPNFGRDY